MDRLPTVTVAELDRDPHGLFRHYRPLTAAIRRAEGGYIALRAQDVESLITDPRTRQMETESLQARGVREGNLFDFFAKSMLFTNSSDHRRRRAPVSRAFAWKLIQELRPRVRLVAGELLDSAASERELNFLDGFCAQIPARIVSEMLGLPREDIPQFTRWVYTLSRAIGASFTPADVPEIEAAAGNLKDYVSMLLTDRRATPREDFLTSYVKSVDEADNLSALEITVQIMTLILGGSDTTRAAMAVQTSLLLQHRDQWDALCADPSLIPGAVSESLRFEPPVASVPRIPLEDIDLDGSIIPCGQMLTLSTISAMRDPARYSEPDVFNIRRTDGPKHHLVFGGGPHRCLGEQLARAELEESLSVLTMRLPNLSLAGDPPTLKGHAGIRRIGPMHVRW